MYEELIAERVGKLDTEDAFTILAAAMKLEAEGKTVVHMEIGQPDFKTPENIVEAGCRALKEGYTSYAPSAGYPAFRQAIADYAEKYKHIHTNIDEIVVVPGGKPIMFYTMLLLTQKGDEVIYPDPGFPIYKSVIKFCGATPVPMPLRASDNFSIDYEKLEASITEHTKLLIINNPSNPTGKVFSKEEITKLAEVLSRHPQVMVLSDEIYDRLIFRGETVSIASLPGMKDRTIILDGFSKAYAMTGWRLGYGIMNKSFAEKVTKLMVNSNSCVASFTQMAGIEALTGPQDTVETMKAAFHERIDTVVDLLNAVPGIRCNRPDGAFYVFPDISSFGLSSKEFASRLMQEFYVAASSGTGFGDYGEGCIRLSCATSMENIRECVRRIEAFTKTLK